MRRSLITFASLFLFALGGFTQNLSNRGKEFYVGYGHHQFMELTVTGATYNSQEMVLYFSAEEPANVTVSINGTGWVRNYSIPANTVIASEFLPKAGADDCRLWDISPPAGTGGEGVFQRGIYISSDVPIVAYAHTFGSASSGATMLMPVETWGYSYISVNSRQSYQSNCFSWAYAVAQHDNTVIEIIPSVPTRNGRPANVPFTVTLNKGEIYQVIGANPGNTVAALEVSGTKFRSIANAQGECYPIAVFSGSSRTHNPISCGSGGGDNDNQQLFPTQAWGKRYLTAPTSSSTSPSTFMRNSYKVLVKDPTTQVRRNGVLLTGLFNNYYFFESNTADIITADKPIMVAQFMTGGGCLNGGQGDPEMIYISPLEQGIKRIGFFRNNAEAITTNYLQLIVPNTGTGLSSLRIDGFSLASLPAGVYHTYTHPQMPNRTVVIRRWSGFAAYPATPPGQCLVSSDSAFTAITFGLGSVESYGYNAGTMINNLNAISSIQNTLDPSSAEHPFTCVGTPMKLSALMAYQPTRLVWQLSQLGTAITPNADVTDNAPVSSATVVINGITYYKYTLPLTYTFNVADTHTISLLATHPSIEQCNQTEELKIQVIVKDKPRNNFTFTHTGCTLDTVYFNGSLNNAEGFVFNGWNWTFPGPVTATGQSPRTVLSPGTHDIFLTSVSAEGCKADTMKQVTVYPKPTTSISATPAQICQDGSITFTPNSTYQDPALLNGWYWDFGNGNTITVPNSNAQTQSYSSYGTFTVKQVAKFGNLCISDTAEFVVTIHAKPFTSFTYPAGCLPADGNVQFNSTSFAPDGQAITGYTWDFGDPNANPGNPNTSTLPNPSHIYTAFGNYNIQYSATTVNGCRKDTTVQATFNVKPVLSFTALSPVCENITGTVSVANGSVTNGVPGTGIYRGPATDAAGNFTPSMAGYGVHTIWYVYESTAGCKDSLSQNIVVYAKPRPNFTYTSTACLTPDGRVDFTNTSTTPDGQTMTWLWNFNDPNAGGGNPNTSTVQNPSHNFREGTYPVNLQATTNNGCVRDTTINITLAVTPALTYAPLAPVCENVPAFSIASAIVTNNVTGNGVYSGQGTSSTGQFDPSAAGAGTHTITYMFTSAGGCTQSVTSQIQVYPRPTSSFTIDNSICLNDPLTVTSTATIPSGNITTWNWDLGNGNTPSNNNGNPFVVNYTTANTYTITLVTLSDRGCASLPTSQQVIVNPLPFVDFNLPANVCMPGGVATFNNVSSIPVPGNPALNYVWTFGDGPGTSNAVNPSHTYATPGSYTVTLIATSTAGCTGQAQKVMDRFTLRPTADFNVNPQELCQGADNVFNDASIPNGNPITSWSWNFDDGNTSTLQNPTKRFNSPGVYDVTLIVNNAAGCASLPIVKPVTVHLQPVIDAGISFVVPQGTIIQATASANSNNLTFNWTPAVNLSDATVLQPLINAQTDETYTLTATGDFGCTATDFMTVKILKPIKVPNVFSPNGDNIHDRWMIPNLADYPGCTVEIFNRYGQQIYYSNGYAQPWDGTHRGKAMPVGTYYYIIQLQNGFKPVTGSVTIIR